MKKSSNIATSTIAGTIAFRNTAMANKFLLAAGYGPSQSPEEIAYKLNNYIAEYGDEALEGLKEIHPDRELLTPQQAANQPAPQTMMQATGHFNCLGGGTAMVNPVTGEMMYSKSAGQNNFHNADGDPDCKRSTNLIDKNSTMMIGIFCITAIAIIALSRNHAVQAR